MAALEPKHGPKTFVTERQEDARAAALKYLTANAVIADADLQAVLEDIRVASVELGQHYAVAAIPGASLPEDARVVDDWEGWLPTAAAATLLVALLDDSLGSVSAASAGIVDTTLAGMARSVGDGVSKGWPAADIVEVVEARADDAMRGEMIARTETNAAVEGAATAAYEDNGVDRWSWQTDGDPCADCSALEGNVFSVGDEAPPLHPNCNCYTAPVVQADG